MKKFAFVALALLGSASIAYAQDFAALAPIGNAAVLDRCEMVADRQNQGDSSLDGQCISAVEARLAALTTSVPPADLNQTIADLVVQLAAIAQLNPRCNLVDTEIAEAIAEARSYSTDPDQQALLAEIAATVAACQVAQTAAIAPVANPASAFQ